MEQKCIISNAMSMIQSSSAAKLRKKHKGEDGMKTNKLLKRIEKNYEIGCREMDDTKEAMTRWWPDKFAFQLVSSRSSAGEVIFFPFSVHVFSLLQHEIG